MPVPRPVAVSVLVLALSAGAASASPFEDPALGEAVFTGPTQAHPTSVFVNPAALGLLPNGHHVFAQAVGQLDDYRIARLQLTDPAQGLQLGPTVDAQTLSAGGMLAYLYGSERLTLGFSVGLPHRHELIDDDDALAYHARRGHFYRIAPASVSVAGRAGPVYGGVTFSVSTSTLLELDFARDTALEAGSGAERGIASDCGGSPCGIENPLARQIYRLDTRTDTFDLRSSVLTIGAILVLPRGWFAGASYQGPPGLYAPLRLTGTARVSDAPRDGTAVRRGDAEIVFDPPQTFWLGARGPVVPGLDVVLSARYHHLSRMDRLDIYMFGGTLGTGDVPEWYPRYLGFSDVVTLASGVEQTAGSTVRFGGRVQVESPAVSSDSVSPLFVSGWNLGANAGVEVRLGPSFFLAAGYGLRWYPAITSSPSDFDPLDRLACVDSGFDFDACQAAREGRALPTAAGTYERFGHHATFSVRWAPL